MKSIITAIIILIAGHAHAATNLVYAGQPKGLQAVVILTNEAYIVGYSEAQKCPLWVCYRIRRAGIGSFNAPPRPKNFRIDQRTTSKVKPSDYTNTGYDRGHMAPNFAIALGYSTNAQRETFLMSNIVPQKPELNRGPWKKLEMMAIKWAYNKYGNIWVVTGPIFRRDRTNRISGVRIPEGCYKILLHEGPDDIVHTLAFGMPQSVETTDGPHFFQMTVDDIERFTGLDFFHELPDELEESIEKGLW